MRWKVADATKTTVVIADEGKSGANRAAQNA